LFELRNLSKASSVSGLDFTALATFGLNSLSAKGLLGAIYKGERASTGEENLSGYSTLGIHRDAFVFLIP
jgi:hypothetical protein